MSNTIEEFKKLPGVMSLTRRINVTDALFYNIMGDNSEKPLLVMRSGLRGTQNVNGDKKESREVNNIQMTDVAKTGVEATGLAVKLGLSFMPLASSINSLARSGSDEKDLLINFKASFDGFIQRAIDEKNALLEIGCRYARNIANGRWLWRNRQFAHSVKIDIDANGKVYTFDALSMPMNDFADYLPSEKEVGQLIADCLAGKNTLTLQVAAYLDFGGKMNSSIEVYPSQNYLSDKPKGFARSLYAVGQSKLTRSPDLVEFEATRVVGQAAIRDTKVANALRTFDTWYPDYDEYQMPIAVEPAGANLGTQVMHRGGKKDSSFAYFKRLNSIAPSSDEGLFVIASIIRGGVYSESGK